MCPLASHGTGPSHGSGREGGGWRGCHTRKKPPSGVLCAWYLTEVACEVFTVYTMNIIQSTSFRYRIPPGTTFPSSTDPRRPKPLRRGLRPWRRTWATWSINFPAPSCAEGS